MTAFNATLTIVALILCNHTSSEDAPTPYEATGTSERALRDSLAEALACLPLIDKGNKMVDKCARFAVTLNHCLHLLGKNKYGPDRCIPLFVSDGNATNQTKKALKWAPTMAREVRWLWKHLGCTIRMLCHTLTLPFPSIRVISILELWAGTLTFCPHLGTAQGTVFRKRICFASIWGAQHRRSCIYEIVNCIYVHLSRVPSVNDRCKLRRTDDS